MSLTATERTTKWNANHPQRRLEIAARHRVLFPRTSEVRRAEHLKERQIFHAAKDQQYEKQKGICTLCGTPLPAIEKCHWDHNHETGKMRDVLHSRCNIALGYIEDDLYPLALDYLKRHANV